MNRDGNCGFAENFSNHIHLMERSISALEFKFPYQFTDKNIRESAD